MLLKACMFLWYACSSLCDLENLEHSHPGSVRSGVTWLPFPCQESQPMLTYPPGLTTASRAHPTVFISTSHMLGWHLLECICHTCSGCWNHCACVWMDYVINSSRCVRAPLLFCPASAPHPKQGRWQNNLQYRMLCQYTLKKQAFE